MWRLSDITKAGAEEGERVGVSPSEAGERRRLRKQGKGGSIGPAKSEYRSAYYLKAVGARKIQALGQNQKGQKKFMVTGAPVGGSLKSREGGGE